MTTDLLAIQNKMRLFFEDPFSYRKPPGKFGVLYLLRRDINSCLGCDVSLKERSDRQIQWPGAMAILAGIDLLAKFYSGKDGNGVGRRFKNFLKKYLRLNGPKSELIYQLRNALLHSFGLYSKTCDEHVYRFRLTADGSEFLKWRTLARETRVVVDLLSLHENFESAVAAYHRDLLRDDMLQRNFSLMFQYYGIVDIGGVDMQKKHDL